MFHSSQTTFGRNLWRASVACLIVSWPLSLHAAVVNKYTFNNGSAADSVGGMNGTVVDNTGISSFTGGTINLSANNGAGSGQDFNNPATVGAFVDLPNGIFTSAVNNGVFGQASLEIWFSVQQHHDWAEVFTFGTSDGGEGVSGGGADSDYVALIPKSGGGFNDFRATTKAAAGDPEETPIIGSPTPLALNQKHHVVMTFDIFDSTAGPNGTTKLYLNNGAPVSAEIRPFIDSMLDNNNWLGRSQWGDGLFDGFIDEFRVHDSAMTPAEIAASVPDPAPLPVLIVNRDTGAISIKNETLGNIVLKGYTIGSAGGALDPLSWSSIDTGNLFDNNGTWTTQSLTTLSIAESVTGGTTDGGTINGNASWSIGTPWQETPIEDLTFSFTLGDNSTGTGLVQYIGSEVDRSDLNGDGSINAADWTTFVQNSYADLSSQSAVGAYLKGDLDGDLDNDYQDFQLFKSDYIAANGLSGFNALFTSVPEPSSMVLILFASLMLSARRK